MKKYKIVTLPKPVLLGEMKSISKFNKDTVELAKAMDEAMVRYHGVGLAAPQIGLAIKMFVVAHSKGTLSFINPEIYWTSNASDIEEEGCLSIPGHFMPVMRFKSLKIRYYDEFGEQHDIKAIGFLARVIQHEYDHINGILINKRAEELERLKK
jgi:peptide deformylase